MLIDIKEEGLKNVFKKHNRLARATRAAVQSMGLQMVAPDSPADRVPRAVLFLKESWVQN